jgi:hypothetical protein
MRRVCIDQKLCLSNFKKRVSVAGPIDHVAEEGDLYFMQLLELIGLMGLIRFVGVFCLG